MSIRVCGLHNVMSFVKDADFIVGITDHKVKSPVTSVNVPQVCVQFDDTEHPSDTEFMTMQLNVRRILNSIASSKLSLDSNIVVHCHAGVSRSSATAWLILIMLGMDFKDAFTLLFKQHSNIWPNKVVLGIGASILKLPKEFTDFVDQVDSEIAGNKTSPLGYGG